MKMHLQVIELTFYHDTLVKNETYEINWDWTNPNHSYYHWFLWFANDPPSELRISEIDDQELFDSLCGFFDKAPYGVRKVDGNEILYQKGDLVYGVEIGTGKHRIRIFISPKFNLA